MDSRDPSSTSSLRSRARTVLSSINNSSLGTAPDEYDPESHASSRSESSTHFLMLIRLLEEANLPGPMLLIADRSPIGQGAQFAVYKQTLMLGKRQKTYELVAVKQPKFDLNWTNTGVDLSDDASKNNVNNVIIEVKALTTPALACHRNIVRLLSWSIDVDAWHRPITLILELGTSDLLELLTKAAYTAETISASQQYTICADVASGLDAIHDCEMIHGDLKPANVLIFQDKNGLVAKLADFGLAVGLGSLAEKGYKTRLHGTPGWQAPEVERGQLMAYEELQRADVYSFGLLAWSVILRNGRPPSRIPNEQISKCLEEDTQHIALSKELRSELTQVVTGALQSEAERRPHRPGSRLASEKHMADVHDIGQILLDQSIGQHGRYGEVDAASDLAEDILELDLSNTGPESSDSGFPPYTWELPAIPEHFVFSLISQFSKDAQTIEPDMLFSLFLCLTNKFHEEYNISNGLRLDVLTASARRGFDPARAVIPVVFEYYQQAYPKDVEEELRGWLATAIASGSLMAKHSIGNDPEVLSDAIQGFQAKGGYAEQLCSVNSLLSPLHYVATFGTTAELKRLVDSSPSLCLEERTPDGETAVYLAMARGAWDMAFFLLERGADATVVCTDFNISCLHWIFSLDPDAQPLAVSELTRRGAEINITVPLKVPFLHWPFVLPAGTPLHWAVALKAETAVRSLLQHGARPDIRDKSDPYRYDPDLRTLNNFGSIVQEVFSVPQTPPCGLSALDYAAMNHDPTIFETLLELGGFTNINSADEEGMTVLHHLSYTTTRRARSGFRYSDLPFRGSKERNLDGLRRTVLAIKSLGGDLNKLTTPQSSIKRNGISVQFPDFTPLMLAARRGCASVVRCLVEAGADLEAEDSEKATAIRFLGHSSEKEEMFQIAHTLVSAGADIHHKDHYGNTALLAAAQNKHVEIMELLLSMGADPTERDEVPGNAHVKATIWALAAGGLDELTERRLSCLLEQYVLLQGNPHVVAEVVDRPDLRGVKLLHTLASRLMLSSVKVMILHGADVNACSRRDRIRTEYVDGRPVDVRVEWQESPLDAVLVEKARVIEQMQSRKRYNMDQFEDLCRLADLIAQALRDAGGVEAPRNETRTCC